MVERHSGLWDECPIRRPHRDRGWFAGGRLLHLLLLGSCSRFNFRDELHHRRSWCLHDHRHLHPDRYDRGAQRRNRDDDVHGFSTGPDDQRSNSFCPGIQWLDDCGCSDGGCVVRLGWQREVDGECNGFELQRIGCRHLFHDDLLHVSQRDRWRTGVQLHLGQWNCNRGHHSTDGGLGGRRYCGNQYDRWSRSEDQRKCHPIGSHHRQWCLESPLQYWSGLESDRKPQSDRPVERVWRYFKAPLRGFDCIVTGQN